MRLKLLIAMLALLPGGAFAQSELYPQHFDLSEVTLLDGPLKTAQDGNARLLLDYDADRLLTPFIRQAGLTTGRYAGWVSRHPSFSNWGLSDWSLEGHVGGHYLSALAMAYAAERDEALRSSLKERLDYCIDVLKDCQDAFDSNTTGLRGFIGGQPINQVWTGLYANNLTEFRRYGGWVPFYCEHKVLAGLRDAWVYAGNETARECFRGLADWAVNVVSNLSDSDMQTVLGWEHGGMNETLADAFALFGDMKYLEAAKRYSHQYEINGMQGTTYNKHFLDNQHANTQVPKFIGFERVWRMYAKAKTGVDMNSTINPNAFNNCTGLTEITIPSQVTSISTGAFLGCSNLTVVSVEATEPPSIGTTTFARETKVGTLRVPVGTRDIYLAAPNWKSFSTIEEFIPSAIKPEISESSPEASSGQLYDLSGKRVLSPSPGHIYIRNGKKTIIHP